MRRTRKRGEKRRLEKYDLLFVVLAQQPSKQRQQVAEVEGVKSFYTLHDEVINFPLFSRSL